MFNSILGRNRDAFHPRVFGPPTHITSSYLYTASIRLPTIAFPGAKGRATRASIRTSTASAGTLVLMKDPNTGYPYYTVQYPEIPIDR